MRGFEGFEKVIRDMREIRYRLVRSRRDRMAIREIRGGMRKLGILRNKGGRKRHKGDVLGRA